MKSNWTSKKIQGITTKYLDFRGKTPLKLGMDWGGGDIPALSANNVEMGKVNFDKECYYGSEKLYKKWMNKGDCAKGDIILTMEAPLGNIAQIPDDKRYILSQRTLLLKLQEQLVEKDFVFYLLSGENFQKKLQQNSTGSTVLGIQQKKLNKIEIVYPEDKKVQRKISKILNTADAVIEKTEAAIAKYRAIKQGMMQDLFTRGIDLQTGQLRSAYKDAPHLYKETELGWIPEEWEVKFLKNLTIKIADRDHFTPIYFEDGVPIISPKDFDENDKITFSKCKFISLAAHLKNRKKTNLETNDLVFTRIGAGLGKVCMVESWMPEFSILHSACMIKVDQEKVIPGYLEEFIKSSVLQRQIKVEVQSIGVPDLGLDKINSFKVLQPNIEEQKLISHRFQSINETIFKEVVGLNKFKDLKRGLMQDLLTGKVEVEV